MGDVTGVRPADHSWTLWLSTIAFTVSFAVWTIFSIIGVQIKADLDLNETQFGLLVGTPILTGSLIRLNLGIWTDQHGGPIVYTAVTDFPPRRSWIGDCRRVLRGRHRLRLQMVSRERQETALGVFGAAMWARR